MKLTDILVTDLNNPDDDRAEIALDLADVKLIVTNSNVYYIVDMEADDGTLCVGVKSIVEPIYELWLADQLSNLLED